MDFEGKVLQDLHHIIEKQTEHTVQLALNTQVLTEHHRRTTFLEARVKPLEDNHIFVHKLLKSFAGMVTLAGGCIALYHYLFK